MTIDHDDPLQRRLDDVSASIDRFGADHDGHSVVGFLEALAVRVDQLAKRAAAGAEHLEGLEVRATQLERRRAS